MAVAAEAAAASAPVAWRLKQQQTDTIGTVSDSTTDTSTSITTSQYYISIQVTALPVLTTGTSSVSRPHVTT